MIKFSLACDRGHTFESWFPDGEDYESQARRGLVLCPDCNSKQVRKAPMAPAVLVGRRPRRAEEPSDDPTRRAARRKTARIARGADAPCVGRSRRGPTTSVTKFPEVARAIHAGDEPERAIRGRATAAEARALLEEGVGVMPLPILPDEAN